MKKTVILTLVLAIVTLSFPLSAVSETYFTAALSGPAYTGEDTEVEYSITIDNIGEDGLIGYNLEVTYDDEAVTLLKNSVADSNVPKEWDETPPAKRVIDNQDGTTTCIISNYDAVVLNQTYAVVTDGMPNITVSFKLRLVAGYSGRSFNIGVKAKGTKLDANKTASSVAGEGSSMSIFIGTPVYNVKNDDKIDILDVIALKGKYTQTLTEDDYSYDYNCDGKIDDTDALYLQKFILEATP